MGPGTWDTNFRVSRWRASGVDTATLILYKTCPVSNSEVNTQCPTPCKFQKRVLGFTYILYNISCTGLSFCMRFTKTPWIDSKDISFLEYTPVQMAYHGFLARHLRCCHIKKDFHAVVHATSFMPDHPPRNSTWKAESWKFFKHSHWVGEKSDKIIFIMVYIYTYIGVFIHSSPLTSLISSSSYH